MYYGCIIMGYFNHVNIKWDTTCIRTNQSSEGVRYRAVLTDKNS